MSGPLLTLNAVTVRYPARDRGSSAVTAVADVGLTVSGGQLLCLAGRSGSGKTTILSVATGLLPPTSGSVLWSDRDIYRMSEAERATVRGTTVGVMFQGGGLLPTLTALENTILAAAPGTRRRDRTALKRRALDQLAALGLSDRASHFPSQLSGGEQHRVALARALLTEPTLLVVDEPTAALDRRTSAAIVALLVATRTPERAILIASHDPQVMTAADHVIQLDDGQSGDDVMEQATDQQ